MQISVDRLREVFVYDSENGVFLWKSSNHVHDAGDVAGSFDKSLGYVTLFVDGTKIVAHRVAWAMVHGKWPISRIDHKDRNRSNNRINNLREASPAQNRVNSPTNKNSKSGYKGVAASRCGTRWRARISFARKTIHLGTHATKEEAHAAYLAAARKFYGEFANTAMEG